MVSSEKSYFTDGLDVINGGLHDNPLSKESEEEIVEWIRIDNDEPIKEKLADEAIIQNVNPQTLNLWEPESDDDQREENKQIHWGEAEDALNKFITFPEENSRYNCAKLIDLHIL